MASVALLIGGAIANALAFTGSNYLFSRLSGTDSLEEQKRHNNALEQLQAATAEWQKERTQRLDFIHKKLRQQQHAVNTFQDVDTAMQEYYKVTGEQLPPFPNKPQLSDYYSPSEGQKDRELVFIVAAMAVSGFIAYKIAKY